MTESIDDAFERVLVADRLLLTPRQQMWMAFKAGADWALDQAREQININLINKPSEDVCPKNSSPSDGKDGEQS